MSEHTVLEISADEVSEFIKEKMRELTEKKGARFAHAVRHCMEMQRVLSMGATVLDAMNKLNINMPSSLKHTYTETVSKASCMAAAMIMDVAVFDDEGDICEIADTDAEMLQELVNTANKLAHECHKRTLKAAMRGEANINESSSEDESETKIIH